MNSNTELIIYTTDDGVTKVEATFDGDTVWLSQEQMGELFQRDKSTISRHIRNIFAEGELDEKVVVAEIATTSPHGAMKGKTQNNITRVYNLDVIISVGYRVKSLRGTQFRIWATGILKEYMQKGFALDDERLKGNGGGSYWKELLDRIRDIRSSEKVLYRQVLDLYATSIDYNPKAPESVRLFKIVQNKLHFAAHGHTAAEVIYERANADQHMMGLTSFKGDHPTLRDAKIAKNYLSAEELKVLNNLVSGYFDFAEVQAIKHRPMYMNDYIKHLDAILSSTGEVLLMDAGMISHEQAMDKAETEYRKWEVRTLSPVEQAYLNSIKTLNHKTKKKG